MRVVFDAEFDSLTPTRVWCIVCKDIDTGERYVFRFDKKGWATAFRRFAGNVNTWVGLNSLAFDAPNLNYLVGEGLLVPADKSLDLLIVSRLVWYSRPGGHSVKAWGKHFGMDKPEIDVYDDPTMIDEYVNRCIEDVEIQHRIYLELLRFIDDPVWQPAIRMEHEMQLICLDMHENGFAFDNDQAKVYLDKIIAEMEVLEEQMKRDIPFVLVQEKPITLREKKDGSRTAIVDRVVGHRDFEYTDGAVFHRFRHEPFNPGSTKQRIELLNASGWKPFEKTKGHNQCERDLFQAQKFKRLKKIKELLAKREKFRVYGWKCNEDNLATLPASAPEGARILATWLALEGRRAFLVEWMSEYNEGSGRIHGSFNGLGSWTQRMSHVRPNSANIFSEFHPGQCRDEEYPTSVEDVKLRFNGLLRGLWRAEPGAYLLGTDAEGIQARILAHYLDSPDYTKAIETGDKKLGTDIHSLNRLLLGEVCSSRDDAKTFYYAWVLGAGHPKIAAILGCNTREAGTAVCLFLDGTPGLRDLKRVRIPSDARQGYFIGLDGRKVVVPGEHYVLAGYLQNGESLVMKYANLLWRRWADLDDLDYKQVNFVHDEWQTEVYTMEDADYLGKLQRNAIVRVGEELGVKCALAGESKIGRNWKETH